MEKLNLEPVSFNSTTKTVVNHKVSFKNAFQEVLYKIDN